MDDAVYIAGVTTRLPRLFEPDDCMNILYPPEVANGRVNRLACRAARSTGIRYRPSVLDPATFPVRSLALPDFQPLEWCRGMVAELAEASVGAADIGFLGVAYNISFDRDVLPSLSSRVATAVPLALTAPPEERAFYGCAGGVFSLASAVEFCRTSDRSAAVCVFDQCSWIVNPIHDMKHPDFRDSLRTSLIFSDGAAGLVLVPGSQRAKLRRPMMRILDIACDFVPGTAVRMSGGHLVLSEGLQDVVPELISKRLVRPLLERNGLQPGDIDEWALHQGGMPILDRFRDADTLGLTATQTERAAKLFSIYGNFSAPSWMFVLDSFFHDDPSGKQGRKGVIASFGAGYYMGAALYEWDEG